MSTLAPTFDDTIVALAAVNISAGALGRAQLDLQDKLGAWILAQIGRGAAGDPTNAPTFAVYRRGLDTDESHPGALLELACTGGSAVETAIDTDASAGAFAIEVADDSGFAAGDIIMIQNADETFTRLEWNIVAAVASDVLTLRLPLRYAHTAVQGDEVSNKADCFAPIWLPGGSAYDIVVDHAQGSGVGVTARVLACRADGHMIA